MACDVEGWSDRPVPAQQAVQTALLGVLERSLAAVDVTLEGLSVNKAGDSVVVALPTTTSKTVLTTLLPEALRRELIENQRTAGPDEHLRLRVVLHDGEAGFDGSQFSGAVVEACRVLDADVCRRVLAAAGGAPLVLALTERWYQDTVARGLGGPAVYAHVCLASKEFEGTAWLTVPGRSKVPGLTAHDAPGAASPESAGGAPAGSGLRAENVKAERLTMANFNDVRARDIHIGDTINVSPSPGVDR